MNKNRDTTSPIVAVLEAANTGETKTRIMYKANLSFKLLKKYLKKALDLGFIRLNGSCDELTKKGQKFLSQYKNFHRRYINAQETLENLSSERTLLEGKCQENTTKTTTKSTETMKQ